MASSAKHLVLAILVAVLGVGCVGAQRGSAPDPAAPIQAVLSAGPWRLVDYRPQVALDPMTQALLALQVRSMVVTFDGRTMHATSSTLTFERPYVVEGPSIYAFDLVSPDFGGGYLRSHCEVSEDGRRIVFHAQTDPWNGTGTIEREGR
jgi:hypothetical protein